MPIIKHEEVFGYKFIEEDITENKKIESVAESIIDDEFIDLDFEYFENQQKATLNII